MGYPLPPSYAEPGGPTVNNIFRDDTHNFSRNGTSTTRELPTVSIAFSRFKKALTESKSLIIDSWC